MQTSMQIGKNGPTSGVIEALKNAFKTHQLVKISVLKSAGRDKEGIEKMNSKILGELGNKFTSKIIGFTIIVRKWRKAKR